jgi:hypothetical protein
LGAQRLHRHGAAGQRDRHPTIPFRSETAVANDVDPAVGVVDPIHGDLRDAQAGPLGQQQELGVEEPAVV